MSGSDAPHAGSGGPASPAAFRMTDALSAALAGAPVRVGTENAAKLEAVRRALASLQQDPASAPPLQIVKGAVASGVAEQPVGYEEIVAGARNRARAAFALGPAALGIGIEDGLVRFPDGLAGGDGLGIYNVGCAWICDGIGEQARESAGFSSGFAYPPGCAAPAVASRAPIGELFDALWHEQREDEDEAPSGPRGGNIGKLTGGQLGRADYGSSAILCALVRFLHKDLYD